MEIRIRFLKFVLSMLCQSLFLQAKCLGNCSRLFIKCLEWFCGHVDDEIQHLKCLSTIKMHGEMIFERVLIHSLL